MKFKTLLNFQFVLLAFWLETWILHREVSVQFIVLQKSIQTNCVYRHGQ